jgi:Raf kinase inhibitor-like YbhB/YbcL family protein
MEGTMRFLSIIASSLLFSFFAFSAHAADDLAVSTTAFLDQGLLPVLYTCDGKDLSPAMSWTNPPAKAQSYAIVMTDPDAPSGMWYHWVVYNIPVATTSLAEGTTEYPAGSLIGKNSWKNAKYNGPCPPKGSSHSYIFTLYALDTKLKLPAGADGKEVEEAIKNHVIQKAQLNAVYSRWIK